MSVRLFSASISGIDAQLIEVEVDSVAGLHSFNIVGLPDKAVEESKERIASAIRNNSLLPPSAKNKKIIVNLAPADIKKEGPAYDLPIAIGYLLETGQIKFNAKEKMFAGELSLDGTVKKINGALSVAILAQKLGFKELIIPSVNTKETSVIDGVSIIGVENIKQLISHLDGTNVLSNKKVSPPDSISNSCQYVPESFLAIKGQNMAKRALIIAATGSHNILMSGPPGSGKTLLAKALNELIPPLSLGEAIEVAKIYSSVGLLNGGVLNLRRPFRNPHHTTSPPAIIGGGTHPKPGEISLAHRGILFLDELPEFPRNVIESLRQPMEDGVVTVSRASGSVVLPAKFTLVAAMNPCPCGNYGDEKNNCICDPFSIIRYKKKLSGPLLDRIDIQINVPRETVTSSRPQMSVSEFNDLRSKILKARLIQENRLSKYGLHSNSEIDFKNVDKLCLLDEKADELIKKAVDIKGLSLRTYHKIKKLARTIADLDGSELIKENHVAEALSYRINDSLSANN